MRMNSFAGKQILSLVRDGDYAHAGEEEAIQLALRPYPPQAERQVLDVGCGRAGTARFVQEHGWGQVVGLDRDAESIAWARQAYPNLQLHACDVLQAASVLTQRFDLIYLFNSFYAFPEQAHALAVLAQLAREGGQLMLFDYVNRGGFDPLSLVNEGEPVIPHPLRLDELEAALTQAGWRQVAVEDLNAAYERWYETLVQRIDGKRSAITQLAGDEGFQDVRSQYAGLLAAIRNGTLGGAIVRADRRPPGA